MPLRIEIAIISLNQIYFLSGCLEKAEEPEIHWIIEKAWEFQKNTYFCFTGASLVAQMIKHLPAMRETWVRSLGLEDALEKEMATHSSILAWRIPWTEEPGGLQSMRSQRVRHDWATHFHFQAGWQYTALMCSFFYLEPACCSMSSSNCYYLTCI